MRRRLNIVGKQVRRRNPANRLTFKKQNNFECTNVMEA